MEINNFKKIIAGELEPLAQKFSGLAESAKKLVIGKIETAVSNAVNRLLGGFPGVMPISGNSKYEQKKLPIVTPVQPNLLKPEKLHRDEEAISELKERYFPGEDVVIFRRYLPFNPEPSLDVLTFDSGTQKSEKSRYGVFRVRRSYSQKEALMMATRSEQIHGIIKKSPIKNIRKFLFPPDFRTLPKIDCDRITEFFHKPIRFPETPSQFFHVCDAKAGALEMYRKIGIFGPTIFKNGLPSPMLMGQPTHISTSESRALSNFSQLSNTPKLLHEVIIDGNKLAELRNIFLDPESTKPENLADYGLNYMTGHGIPYEAVLGIRELEATDILILGESQVK